MDQVFSKATTHAKAAETPSSQEPEPVIEEKVNHKISQESVATHEKKAPTAEPEVDMDDMINNLQQMYKIQQVQQTKDEFK